MPPPQPPTLSKESLQATLRVHKGPQLVADQHQSQPNGLFCPPNKKPMGKYALNRKSVYPSNPSRSTFSFFARGTPALAKLFWTLLREEGLNHAVNELVNKTAGGATAGVVTHMF